MDLFVVNRYEENDLENPEKPEDHLSQLLEKIELRKKQRSEAPNDVQEEPAPEEPPKKKKKRKKSVKSSENNEAHVETPIARASEVPPASEPLPRTSEDQNKLNFLVLGGKTRKKKQLVRRVLPKWLSHPERISADLSEGPDLQELQNRLDKDLIERLQSNGINKLFPVQSSLIDWMLRCSEDRRIGWWPRDVCVSAPTGSGKTLAYVLPIIQQLKNRFSPKIKCLVVLPVQELAAQVFKVMLTYSAGTDLKVGLISGAMSFDAEQTNLVKRTARGEFVSRVDIVVATSGRLIDHIEKTEGFSLDFLEFLVIDEADRATDWLKHIPMPHRGAPPFTIRNYKVCKIPPAQKLLFSATLSQDPEKLSNLALFQPILFTSVIISDREDEDVDLDKLTGEFIGRYTSPNELMERAVVCSPEYKPVALAKLITSHSEIVKTLVFTNSGEATHRLALLLRLMLANENVVVDELSAQLMPKQRNEMLKKFIDGKSQVLICSDALARGVDIAGVKLVVSYDLPKHIKGYIHRSGRTGRAGLPGTAISILTSNQVDAFTRMLTTAHKALPTIEQIESLESDAVAMNYHQHIEKLKEFIENERTKGLERTKAKRRFSRKN